MIPAIKKHRVPYLKLLVLEEPESPAVQDDQINMVDVEERRPTSGNRQRQIIDQLERNRRDLMSLKDIIIGKEKDDFIVDEWKCLGKITDRCLFWLCVISFTITLAIILS